MTQAAPVNKFLDRLRAGHLTLMLAVRSGRTQEAVRIAKATGHHAICIDLEHSAITVAQAADMCGTANDLGITPFVRIPERDYGIIGRLLDGGAVGMIAPRIETVQEAEQFSRACRFPPHGQRSALAMVPQYGMRPMPARELNPLLDADTIVKVLLETAEGIANADAIAALPGVDLLSIGANDLSAELGIPGEYGHPRLQECIAVATEACRKHGKLLMVGGISDLTLLEKSLRGGAAPFLMTGMDTEIFFTAAQQRVGRFAEWHAQMGAAN